MEEIKQTSEITYTDIFKHFKEAVVMYQLGESIPKIDNLLQNIAMFGLFSKRMNISDFGQLAKIYKPILPKLTQKRLKEIYNEYAQIRTDREKIKEKLAAAQQRYKADSSIYQKVAEKVYNKRGCPQFKKRIISGVVFGEPYTETNGKSGWDTVIRARYVGVELSINEVGLHCFNVSISF